MMKRKVWKRTGMAHANISNRTHLEVYRSTEPNAEQLIRERFIVQTNNDKHNLRATQKFLKEKK